MRDLSFALQAATFSTWPSKFEIAEMRRWQALFEEARRYDIELQRLGLGSYEPRETSIRIRKPDTRQLRLAVREEITALATEAHRREEQAAADWNDHAERNARPIGFRPGEA